MENIICEYLDQLRIAAHNLSRAAREDKWLAEATRQHYQRGYQRLMTRIAEVGAYDDAARAKLAAELREGKQVCNHADRDDAI